MAVRDTYGAALVTHLSHGIRVGIAHLHRCNPPVRRLLSDMKPTPITRLGTIVATLNVGNGLVNLQAAISAETHFKCRSTIMHSRCTYSVSQFLGKVELVGLDDTIR